MGLIWDLIQHSQIEKAQSRTGSLETRVALIEDQLERTNQTLISLMQLLEKRFGEDLNADGRVG